MHFSTSLSLTEENWLRHDVEGRSREEDTGRHDSGTVVDCREDRSCRIVAIFVMTKSQNLSAEALLSSVAGREVVFLRPIRVFHNTK